MLTAANVRVMAADRRAKSGLLEVQMSSGSGLCARCRGSPCGVQIGHDFGVLSPSPVPSAEVSVGAAERGIPLP